MADEIKEELKAQGFLVIQTSWFVLLIIGFFISIGIGIGVGQSQIADHERRIRTQEIWGQEHQTKQDKLTEYRNRKLDEITFNLRAVSKKLGVDYQTLIENQ